MAYPIQPQAIKNILHSIVWAQFGPPAVSADIIDYCTYITIQRGAKRGQFGIDSDIGYSTFRLKNYPLVSGIPAFKLGDDIGVYVKNTTTPASPYTLFTGKVVNVTVDRQWDPYAGAFDTFTTLEVGDALQAMGNVTVEAYESASYDNAEQLISAIATKAETSRLSSWTAGPTAINRSGWTGTGLDLVNVVNNSTARNVYASKNSFQLGTYSRIFDPAAANPGLTDRTVATTSTMYDYVSAQGGYSLNSNWNAVEVTCHIFPNPPTTTLFNNTQVLKRHEIVPTVRHTIQEKPVTSMDYIGPVTIQNANVIPDPGTTTDLPYLWTSTTYGIGNEPTDIINYNEHGVIKLRCATAHAAGAGLIGFNGQAGNDFVANWATQYKSTGAYVLQFKARAKTGFSYNLQARIVWYDTDDNILRTDTSSNFAVNATAWTTVQLSVTTPPTGAVRGYAICVVNTAVAKGAIFYLTEAMLTRGTTTYFDGDSPSTVGVLGDTFMHGWETSPNTSVSYELKATALVTKLDTQWDANDYYNALPDNIVYNALKYPDFFANLELGTNVVVAFAGQANPATVCGLTHEISADSWETTVNLVNVIGTVA